ncbi:MAG: tRNA (guanosine(46)-N7)-methyltransferase TrmB [Bacteroidales bacterium]|nr:tRNA (guanosine(46)-N7)-methyltransferase TrmB [Bacteroidales bacterium]
MVTKKKLLHFAENITFDNFIQLSYQEVISGVALKGKWEKNFFKNTNPIILELGCGKGEYTVRLAEKYPDKNYIGIDMKGARMWRGCKTSQEKKLKNVAFIRTKIELIKYFFEKNEISEIWLTFPDPQPKKFKARKRLTSPHFLELYNNILRPEGIIHLKTDNTGLFDYTLDVIKENGHQLLYLTKNLCYSGYNDDKILINTFYEKMFLEQNIPIKYLKFKLKSND